MLFSIKLFLAGSFIVPISIFCYNLLNSPIIPVAYDTIPVRPFPKNIVIENTLSEAEQIPTHPYTGPESLICHNGSVYAGVLQGHILQIQQAFTKPSMRVLNKDNNNIRRPLGLRMNHNSTKIIFVDSASGLFSISLADGKIEKIFPKDEDFTTAFLNDFDILPNGNIILSETSSNRTVDMAYLEYMEARPVGRVLLIDPLTGKWKELASGLYFANGVQLHRDQKSVLIAETTTSRVLRLPLDGRPITVFADGLLGHPDNIRLSPRGGYWVPVSNIRTAPISAFMDWASKWPKIRIIVANLLEFPILNRFKYTSSSALIRLDENGDVVEVLQDPRKRFRNVASVCEEDGIVYTGSYFLPFVGRLKL